MKQEIINFILEMILCYFLLRIQIVCNEEKSTLKTIKCKIVGQWNYSNKFDSVKPHFCEKNLTEFYSFGLVFLLIVLSTY